MINRGYFARVQAIKQVVRAFMDGTTTTTTTTTTGAGEGSTCRGQIISLGAGWDTTFFRLCSEANQSQSRCRPSKYIEVDHKEVRQRTSNNGLPTESD